MSTDARRPTATARRPLGPSQVTILGGFLAERQRINRERTLPHGFDQLRHSGALSNLHLAAGADGLLASAGLDGSVRIWRALEAQSDTQVRAAESDRIGSLAFIQGRLAAASTGQGVLLWNPAQPQKAEKPLAARRKIRALAVSTDGKLAAGTDQGAILLWRSGLAQTPVELPGHTGSVTSLSFAPDGSRLASASVDGTLRLWSAAQPEHKPLRLSGHAGWVWAVAFTADGEMLVSGGADRTVRVWPTRPQPLADTVCAHKKRNLTPEEWRAYFPADLPWEATCP